MKVPTLKMQSVAAQGIPGAYQQADVSALSQGGGVAGGISSIGGVLADQAAKAKKQADQVAEFNASADINDASDALYQDFASKDGPAAMQAYEALLPAFDKAASERATTLTPDQRPGYEESARVTRASLAGRATAKADGMRWDMSVSANKRLLQSYGKSAILAVSNGGVRVSQTPSLPESQQARGATGTEGPMLLDERAIAPAAAQAHEANVKFAEAHADQLPTDQASYIAHADALWKEETYKGVMQGLLTRGDDRTAKAFFEKHKADFAADDIDSQQGAVDKATEIGTSQRVAGSAIMSLPPTGTWSEKRAALREKVGDDAGARKATDGWIDAQIKDETERFNDATKSILEGIDAGAPAADAAMAAAGLPLEYRDAVGKALDMRSKGVVAQAQSDFYQEWSTKAAGFNPETGKPDPAMRQEFLDHNFTPNIPDAESGDYSRLIGWQKEGKSGGAAPDKSLVSDDEIANHVVNLTDPSLTGTDRSEKLYDTKRRLDSLWAAESRDGKVLTPSDKQKLADEIMAESVFGKGFLGLSSMTTFEALTADAESLTAEDIPPELRGPIIDSLKSAGVESPTGADIVRAYQAQLREGLLHVLD